MTLAFWKQVEQHLLDQKAVFIAWVADHTKHSPGTRGARLLLTLTDAPWGTIGGGGMEADVLRFGRQALRNPEFQPTVSELIHRKEGSGTKSGLICAGRQTLVYAVLKAHLHLNVVQDALGRLERDEIGRLILTGTGELSIDDVSPTPFEAPNQLQEQGNHWQYEEQLLCLKRIAIFGGGHCGWALSQTMHQLGYTVTLVETRPELPSFADNPFATHKIAVEDFLEAGPKIAHPRWTHVAIMTKDYPSDVQALLGVIDLPFPYLGIMGAPAKLAKIKQAVRAETQNSTLKPRLRAPLGLPIHSDTPEEIAISVAAQIIAERNQLFPGFAPKPL